MSYTIVDEAQFRTLMEIDQAGASAAGNRIDLNETRQDTIVGTDALLANQMTTNVTHSRDRGNTLDIADNPISLSRAPGVQAATITRRCWAILVRM